MSGQHVEILADDEQVFQVDDPADRLIVATALTLGASLATSDARLLAWKGSLARIDARV